jgi:hypothetical protein
MTEPTVVNLEDQRMHPNKRRLVVIAMAAALAVLAPSAAASAASPHRSDLHITKECSAYTHLAGGFCTITSSNLASIPVGSKVIYEQSLVGTVLETDVTLDPPGAGDMAFGHVHLDLVAKVGTAIFTGGTGTFTGFTASVAVTPDVGVAFGWRWEGTYSFGHGNFYLDKTCSPDASPIGYHCTVQHSSFDLFPAGTDVHYAETSKANVVRATIEIPSGSTTGLCVWSSDVNAICTFKHGTGSLAHFRLRVVVTASADQSVWYWNGRFKFTGHHHG